MLAMAPPRAPRTSRFAAWQAVTWRPAGRPAAATAAVLWEQASEEEDCTSSPWDREGDAPGTPEPARHRRRAPASVRAHPGVIRPPAVAHPLVWAACIDTAARSRIYAAARSTIDAAARSRFSSGSTLYMASGPARGFRPRSAVRTLRAQQRGANIKSATISSDRGNCRVENQQVQKELVEKSVVL